MFLVSYNETSKKNEIITIVNTFHKDFFIKVKVINWSHTRETIYGGVTIRAVVTELTNEQYVAVGA